MQHPVGYAIVNGRAQMTDFGALLGNPRALYLFLHTFFAGLVTASFFMLGFSIYHLVKKQEVEAFRKSFVLSALIGLLSTVAVGGAGHIQGVYLREVQPMAAAASEAHYETANPADFHLIAGIDQDGRKTTWSVTIPRALSFLYFFKWEGEVEGLNQVQARYEQLYGPGNYIPNIALTFWSFRVMVGVGLLMGLLSLGALVIAWKKYPEKWIERSGWLVWIILLPYLANTTGWVLTETGRQPWVVHGLMQTKDAVSPNLAPATVLTSLIGFVLIYAVLMVIDLYLLVKFAKKGLGAGDLDSVPIAGEVEAKKKGGK
jgi:cytochrome d ubiquinol oxidase subunit I